MNIVDMRGKLRSKGFYEDYGVSSKTHIIIHHSLTKTGSAEAYARHHVDVNGWPGIGYQFVIEQDGTIKQCQNISANSYHVGDHNKYCVGICLTGDFRTQEPTAAQKRSLCWLVSYLQKTYPQLKTVKGHSDLKGYEWKDCPCFDYSKLLREGAAGATEPKEKWTNENNPYDGSYGTIEAVGGGVNTYTSPYAEGQYVKTIYPGTTYHAYVEKDEYYGIGYNEWVPKKFVNFRQYLAVVTTVGNVNVFDAPSWSAEYKGEVQAGVGYTVYAEKDGWYLLAGNVWIDGQYVMIKK